MTLPSSLRIQEVSGHELDPWMEKLGTLRIRVFRELPYLYDGTMKYEKDYLRIYQECPESRVVLVTGQQESLVGATTCIPLARENEEFRQPFKEANLPVVDFLYLGESLVLPEWRGNGLGRKFFTHRESHAARLGLPKSTFCAVDRPASHPARPNDYRELDRFWSSLGFERQPHLQAQFSWKEVGEPDESPKALTFWTKPMACQRAEISNPEAR